MRRIKYGRSESHSEFAKENQVPITHVSEMTYEMDYCKIYNQTPPNF